MINVNHRTKLISEKETATRNNRPVNLVANIVGWSLKTSQNAWSPPTDIIENEQSITIQVEIAGMNRSDFSIIVDDAQITISGSRYAPNQTGAYQQMEIHSGNFSTTLDLSQKINPEEIQAKYQDGFLTILIPKAPLRSS